MHFQIQTPRIRVGHPALAWQTLSWAHSAQMVTSYIDKICIFSQSKEILGSRIFVTVLNLPIWLWDR